MCSYDSFILLPPWFYPAVSGYYFLPNPPVQSHLSWHVDIRIELLGLQFRTPIRKQGVRF
jgi:hypothetical protein